MIILTEFKPFVKGQLDFHERRARNPDYSPDRRKLHANTAEAFKGLLEAIDKAPRAMRAYRRRLIPAPGPRPQDILDLLHAVNQVLDVRFDPDQPLGLRACGDRCSGAGLLKAFDPA